MTALVKIITMMERLHLLRLVYLPCMSLQVLGLCIMCNTECLRNLRKCVSHVPVGHFMISLYCWHSNANKLFQIKIGSEQNVNFLKTICFMGRPSIDPHYAEAAFMKTTLFLFSHMNFTHEKISHTFNLSLPFLQLLKCSPEKIT